MTILCNGDIRLRPVDLKRDMNSFLLWYNAPNVIFYSEGPKVMPYGREIIERMVKILSEIGENYIIEIYKKDMWTPIGDASITKEKTPITIGVEEYWGKGLGTKVLGMLISRAREIGLKKLKVSGIYEYNERSLRLYRKAGFSETEHFEEDGYNCIKMELVL